MGESSASVWDEQGWADRRMVETAEERVAFDKATAAAWFEDRHAGTYPGAYVPVAHFHNAVREIAWLCRVIEGAWATIDRFHEDNRKAREARRRMVVRDADGVIWARAMEAEVDDA